VLLPLARHLDEDLRTRAYRAALHLGCTPERAKALAAAVAIQDVVDARSPRHVGATGHPDTTDLLQAIGPVSRALRHPTTIDTVRSAATVPAKPAGATETGGATGPGGAADTADATDAYGSAKTTGATKPVGTAKTAGPAWPAGATETRDATDPCGSAKTAGSAKPIGTADTARSAKPIGTADTARSAKPIGVADAVRSAEVAGPFLPWRR